MSEQESVERDAIPLPLTILGVEIGTYSGWDQADTVVLQFYNYIPNEVGKKWLRLDVIEKMDIITVSYDTGNVQRVLYNEANEQDGLVDFHPDWSVFNK